MAKGKVLVKRKAKASRVTKAAQHIADLKRYGDEPLFKGPVPRAELARALNWYSYMSSVEDAREYLETWLKAKAPSQVKALRRVPDDYVPLTAAWLVRLVMRGADVGDEMGYVDRALKEAFNRAPVKEVKKAEAAAAPKPSIQDRVREKINEHIANFEDFLDARDPEFSAYEYLNKNSVPPLIAAGIGEFYQPLAEEVLSAVKKKDLQLHESYSKMGKKRVKELFDFVTKMLQEIDRYIGSTRKAKVSRKPRKKKAVNPEKLVKSFKFKEEDTTLKVKSINPVAVVGAQELWLFNVKTRVLTVLRANTRAGLSLKGTTVLGWDEATSVARKVGRKSQYAVDMVLNGGKIVKRKLMDEFITAAPVKGRTSADTLILAAAKA